LAGIGVPPGDLSNRIANPYTLAFAGAKAKQANAIMDGRGGRSD
jgi:hypothetical protein